MFGSNSVTSSWANPQPNQQQQQPQQGGSVFGQPSAFGGTGGTAFGAFGQAGQQQTQPQQQQPQQPAANPMFGSFGGGTTNPSGAGTSTFGSFGSTPAAPSAGTGLFGTAPKPPGGFGAFGGGGTSTFGGSGTGAFGTTGTTGTAPSVFGQTGTSTGSTFGGGGGLFNKPATTFGANGGANAAGNYETVAPVTTGTANPAYNVFTEKDSANAAVTLQYQAITCMPAYRGNSFEELRVQDYAQGRKTASTSAFGGTTFGAPTPTTTGTGLFGQPPQQPAGGLGSAFGLGQQQQQQPAPSAFGASTTGTGTGTGLFGSFGQTQPQQQQQPQQTSAFGTFSQPQQQQQQQPATGGLFGTGAFGQQTQQQQKPAAFSAFGGGTGAFGQTSQQQQPAQGGGLFSQPQQGTSAFNPLGQSTAPKPSIFGTPAQTTQPATNFGLFGQQQQGQQQQQQQGQQQPAGGLFGGSLFGGQQQQQQQPAQPTGGLFSTQPQQQQQQQQPQQPGGGLFGGNLFSQQQPAQQQQQPQQSAFNLFGGPKPATTTTAPSGGLFGNFGQSSTNTAPAQQTSNLFGSTTGLGQQQQQPATGGGMFGGSMFGKPAGAPALGASTSQGGLGGFGGGSSMFGGSTLGTSSMGAPANQTLMASIDQPISANLPIFSMLPPGPGPRATVDPPPKKKPSLFADVPTRPPGPPVLKPQGKYAPGASRLRGFGQDGSGSGSGLFSSGRSGVLSLTRANVEGLNSLTNGNEVLGMSMGGGRASPALGSGGKQSVKKLILDKKVEPSDFFGKSGMGSPGSPKIAFNPALSVAAREKEAAAGIITVPASSHPRITAESPTPKSSRFPASAKDSHTASKGKAPAKGGEEPDEEELQEGDYFVKPDLRTLVHMGYEELSAMKGLVVGRVGYGQITFLEPVDLTGLAKLGALLGEVVRFDDKECSVYPDSDEVDKPAPGSGLNVPARIELVRCWALDKATREPIKDEKHPMAVKHLKRLQKMKETHFVSFDIQEGKWVFTVDRF
ncbi:hypothetical protein JAAARDRAFT_144613 [Jaapia argillacea MUCL 33604]|uniref:Peptidase S59 domain-containing protein n=1 Tax=Jaapia argillacea MUCL 33604 TaxID=933084 RepID=A0A067QAZ9_9AGAM|nr:hypothetical protein JAAARDRAFT_144613 [Jaapia argillacea MUCL 33604]